MAKKVAFSGIALALALVTGEFIPTIPMPFGGSITLFSMLFISLIGYFYGIGYGLSCGLAFGLLQFILDPKGYTLLQILLDYPIAFMALGLSGFFRAKKYGLQIGYLLGVIGRFLVSTLSGVLFFAEYAPEGTPALLYSAGYQAAYLGPELIITLAILFIPAVSKGIDKISSQAR